MILSLCYIRFNIYCISPIPGGRVRELLLVIRYIFDRGLPAAAEYLYGGPCFSHNLFVLGPLEGEGVHIESYFYDPCSRFKGIGA